jgi:serine/threonine-protein kinase
VIVTELDGLPVRLRVPHDLSFTAHWGSVFAVLDQQDSGNLCLGIEGPAGRVFVKYAGAPTVRYDGAVGTAVANLRRSAEVYYAPNGTRGGRRSRCWRRPGARRVSS